jgi:hypothetical protein
MRIRTSKEALQCGWCWASSIPFTCLQSLFSYFILHRCPVFQIDKYSNQISARIPRFSHSSCKSEHNIKDVHGRRILQQTWERGEGEWLSSCLDRTATCRRSTGCCLGHRNQAGRGVDQKNSWIWHNPSRPTHNQSIYLTQYGDQISFRNIQQSKSLFTILIVKKRGKSM